MIVTPAPIPRSATAAAPHSAATCWSTGTCTDNGCLASTPASRGLGAGRASDVPPVDRPSHTPAGLLPALPRITPPFFLMPSAVALPPAGCAAAAPGSSESSRFTAALAVSVSLEVPADDVRPHWTSAGADPVTTSVTASAAGLMAGSAAGSVAGSVAGPGTRATAGASSAGRVSPMTKDCGLCTVR